MKAKKIDMGSSKSMKNIQQNSPLVLSELAHRIKSILSLNNTLLVSRIRHERVKSSSNGKLSVHNHREDVLNLFDDSVLKVNKPGDKQLCVNDFFDGHILTDKFDYIVADLPLGIKTNKFKQPFDFPIRDNWIIINSLLQNINKNGYGLFLVEPNFKQSSEGKRFITELAAQGIFLNAIFNVPEGSLLPMTSLRPILVLFSRNKNDKLFVAELNEESEVFEILSNFKNSINSNILEFGRLIKREDFETFDNYKIIEQIQAISSQYKEFNRFRLTDISLEVNATRTQFEHKVNSIFLPTIGKSQVLTSIQELTLKHQNYFQIVLDSTKAKNSYLKLYFNSDLGRLTLESLKSGAFISKINKSSVEEIQIPIPSLILQEIIVSTEKKLTDLEHQIVKLKRELSLNPKNAQLIDEKIEGALDLFNVLTEADKLLSIVRKGESKTLEFKETFSKDIKKNTKEKYIEDTALKNIVAFFNTEGGTLLVGVSDGGQVTGIEADIYVSDDKYFLHFKDVFRSRIGEEWYPLIDYRIIVVDDKKVFLIECKKASTPVYLDNKDFFVRSNPSTDKLEGPKLVDYINRHFEK